MYVYMCIYLLLGCIRESSYLLKVGSRSDGDLFLFLKIWDIIKSRIKMVKEMEIVWGERRVR